MSEQYKKPRFRSPSYPSISLSKAVERAESLHLVAQHHKVPKHVLASAWEYKLKSSALNSTAAALDKFGLITAFGSGDSRRYQLTDAAMRILKDVDPQSPKRKRAMKDAALSPTIFRQIWEKFGVTGVSGQADPTILSYLTLDLQEQGEAYFSDSAAQDALSNFQESLRFAGFTNEDVFSDYSNEDDFSENMSKDEVEKPLDVSHENVDVGDWVQWVSNDIERFPSPQKVRAIVPHGGEKWAFVDSSETGIRLSEVVVVKSAEDTSLSPPTMPLIKDNFDSIERKRSFSSGKVSNLDNLFVESTQVDEGAISLEFPSDMSETSYEDFDDWIQMVMKKIKRRVSIEKE